MRDYRFDVARVVCMTYIVAFMHLYAYIYPEGKETFYIPACKTFTDSCLGLFTFISGYLLGKKYQFGSKGNITIWAFFRKRILRIIPLFVLASVFLWLIGFNSLEATINGLMCLSPVANPKPRTLWYIPVILWCYMLTPLVSRKNLNWRIYSSLCLISLSVVARILVPSVDGRLIFNLFFYLLGMISAAGFDWKFTIPYGKVVKIAVILVYVLLIFIGLEYSLLFRPSVVMTVGGVGVFPILFICDGIASKVFPSQGVGQHNPAAIVGKLISCISFASMACYMFHRLFYWLAELLWNPSDPIVKWLFMAGLVFPLILVSSYYIQKGYDSMVKRL